MLEGSANVLQQQQVGIMAATSPEKLAVEQPAENRREARISYCMTVVANGIELCSSNISKNGFQLCCPAMRFDGLSGANQAEPLTLSWTLPLTGAAISALAAVRYANTCDDEVLIGVELVECGAQHKLMWHDFIEDLAARRGLE